jgi:hypothetical protein
VADLALVGHPVAFVEGKVASVCLAVVIDGPVGRGQGLPGRRVRHALTASAVLATTFSR